MWGKKYVVRHKHLPDFPFLGTISYYYKHGYSTNSSHEMGKAQIKLAKRHAFNTRFGAERTIPKRQRFFVCPMSEIQEYSLKHSSKEVNDWLNEKVRNYDWKNSKQNFAVVTFEEMLQEMRQLRKILDE